MKKNILITETSIVTNEGVCLYLNIPTSLKTGKIHSKSFYVSWDKIGEALFDNYCGLQDVEERRKERDNILVSHPEPETARKPIRTAKWTFEINFFDDGTNHMTRINDGFSVHELLCRGPVQA